MHRGGSRLSSVDGFWEHWIHREGGRQHMREKFVILCYSAIASNLTVHISARNAQSTEAYTCRSASVEAGNIKAEDCVLNRW